MPVVSVSLSPFLAELQDFKKKVAVIVDILRATTTITVALEYGVKSLLPVETIEQCLDFQKSGYIGAAERGGRVVEGFKLGNSPFDYMDPCYTGKKIVLTTTNGTRTIASVKKAEKILFGAFVNISAVKEYLMQLQRDLVIVCAGWEGEVNLEDTLFAGNLISMLEPVYAPYGDPAMLAYQLYRRSGKDIGTFLQGSAHLERLKKLGLIKDVDLCLSKDKYDIVPELIDGEIRSSRFDKNSA